jgi:hypothetical protein
MNPWLKAIAGVSVLAAPALAEAAPTLTAEAMTDERRRGLSWSDGKASLRGAVGVNVAQGFSAHGQVTALRNSVRHVARMP